ncbi:hypothetical protein [Halosimplex salinum]|uniref:hypothetical protein n=1 Tax=Halosimplex salinum TaxID=1710538 RepID=UPI000F49689C|nr:hypothetical protein [Halosimplex salinum]
MNEGLLALIFAGQVGIGLASTLVVYKAIERSWAIGWLVGVALVTIVPVAEWMAGEALFEMTTDEMQLVAVVAVIGSLVGVFTMVVLTKPDLKHDDRTTKTEPKADYTEER